MTISLDESYSYCKSLTRRTAGNFYFSFLTLPRKLLRDMCVLYAYMRVSDDIGDDEHAAIDDRKQQLSQWKAESQSALEGGEYSHPVFPALVDLVARHKIPSEHLLAVLDGIQMDLENRSFETFEDLQDYCYHVAGAVGLCCIHIWGFHDSRAIECAIDCGLAFQLTNILRDLGEDAKIPRVYLPQEDLLRFELTADDIARHCGDPRFVELMRFEVERARSYYKQAEKLFDYIDPPGRPILSAMMRIYGGLLNEIERRDYDVFLRRVRIPTWRKLLIVIDSIVRQRLLGRWCRKAADSN